MWNVKPPARANRLGWPRPLSTKSSPRNRWIQRSQCTSIPRYPSQTATKTAACEMSLGLKLCIRSVMIAQCPHKPADRDAEASFVEAHEAYDVALRGLRLGLVCVRGNPRRRPLLGVLRQQPVGDQLLQNRDGGGGLPPRLGVGKI